MAAPVAFTAHMAYDDGPRGHPIDALLNEEE